MKKTLVPLLLTAALAPAARAGTDIGVSISIAQPGLYGRVDVGSVAVPPVLVYAKPVVIVPPPVARPPVYLWVPPGHAKDWKKHCRHYGACGYPVYFVRDDWYRSSYVPVHARGPGGGPPPGKGRSNGHGKDRD